MTAVGQLCLLMAMICSGYAAFAAIVGARSEGRGLGRSAIGAAFTAVAALTVVVVLLAYALVTKDFRFEYVTEYSDPLLPWHYSLSALWVGQAGSLLVWGWFVAVLAVIFRFTSRPRTARFARTGLWHADDLSRFPAGDHGLCRRSDGARRWCRGRRARASVPCSSIRPC